jgi:hypothetical protein
LFTDPTPIVRVGAIDDGDMLDAYRYQSELLVRLTGNGKSVHLIS